MKEAQATEGKRPYRMQARAAASEATRQRILYATIALYMERWIDQFSLEEVAARAGVTVQTVFRRFGTKDGLLAAAGDELYQQVARQRLAAPVGDIAGAIRNLFDHYEEMGALALRALAQEGRYAPIRALTDRGRRFHAEWAAHVFAPLLASATGTDAGRLRAQLTALTDVYVWKLLCRDQGLDREQAERALCEMIAGLPGVSGDVMPRGGDV